MNITQTSKYEPSLTAWPPHLLRTTTSAAESHPERRSRKLIAEGSGPITPMLDTIVFDIETKNTFGDVGGKKNLLHLEPSVACFYSLLKNKYFCFTDKELDEMKEFLSERVILVGFSSNKFDVPILQHTLNLDLMAYPRLDISDEIETRTGRMVGLGDLAHVNLGTEKSGTGLNAPVLYAAGKMEELKEYCRKDVEITKDLFLKIKREGQLIIPPRKTDAIGESTLLEIDISQQLALLS